MEKTEATDIATKTGQTSASNGELNTGRLAIAAARCNGATSDANVCNDQLLGQLAQLKKNVDADNADRELKAAADKHFAVNQETYSTQEKRARELKEMLSRGDVDELAKRDPVAAQTIYEAHRSLARTFYCEESLNWLSRVTNEKDSLSDTYAKAFKISKKEFEEKAKREILAPGAAICQVFASRDPEAAKSWKAHMSKLFVASTLKSAASNLSGIRLPGQVDLVWSLAVNVGGTALTKDSISKKLSEGNVAGAVGDGATQAYYYGSPLAKLGEKYGTEAVAQTSKTLGTKVLPAVGAAISAKYAYTQAVENETAKNWKLGLASQLNAAAATTGGMAAVTLIAGVPTVIGSIPAAATAATLGTISILCAAGAAAADYFYRAEKEEAAAAGSGGSSK